jgi:hepatocyte growth factor-regulated tyrosine kinase substrate
MPLPRLGIVQPVRVCETCYDELNAAKTVKPPSSAIAPTDNQSNRSLQPRNARIEDDDDRDLKRALQMSLEEVMRAGNAGPRQEPSRPANPNNAQTDDAEDDDLKAAIAASLKDMEAKKGIQYPSVQPTQPVNPVNEQPFHEPPPSQSTSSPQPHV